MLQAGALHSRGRRDHSLYAEDARTGRRSPLSFRATLLWCLEGACATRFSRGDHRLARGSLSCRAPRRVPQQDSKASRMIQIYLQQPQLAREIGNYWTSPLIWPTSRSAVTATICDAVPTRWRTCARRVAADSICSSRTIRTRGSRCNLKAAGCDNR